MKKAILLTITVIFLTKCAGFAEMAETGEPPVKWSNTYKGSVKTVTRAGLIREFWNYGAGILSAATNGGIDLRVDEPIDE